MRTTAGSLALAESIAARDAFLVGRLRAAGAVLLAKTNLSEWANIRSTRSTSGWSGRGGQVRNPHALDRNPCGSSSGSGVAAAADLAAAAVGTETDGSVTCPAAMNGIVGLKPTLGMVSRSGVIPIAHSQDTAGPMGRSVEDVALLLEGMVGIDLVDPATAESADRTASGFAAGLAAGALAGSRLGVARNLFGWHPEIDRQMEQVLRVLAGLGATLVDPAEVPNVGEYDESELEVLLYELKHDLNAYLAALAARRASEDARGGDRLQPRPRRSRDALVRPGAVRAGGDEGTARARRPTERRSKPTAASRAPRGWTPCSRASASTPWSVRRWVRPIPRIGSSATTTPARRPRRPRSPATRT